MRRVVHISDLHFGRVDEALVEPLIIAIRQASPHLVAVSGDLTQRARTAEFKAAGDFLRRLPLPQVVVPGNHDIPLYNLLARFRDPLQGYRSHITSDLAPFYVDDEIAALGINTARSLTWKAGRINAVQVTAAGERLCGLAAGVTKIVVTHHPFDLPSGADDHELVGRAEMALRGWAACGVRILLSGHLHTARVGNTGERFAIDGHCALVVQAGTTMSVRTRSETNSFNVLHIADDGTVAIDRHLWDRVAGKFLLGPTERFCLHQGLWRQVPDLTGARAPRDC